MQILNIKNILNTKKYFKILFSILLAFSLFLSNATKSYAFASITFDPTVDLELILNGIVEEATSLAGKAATQIAEKNWLEVLAEISAEKFKKKIISTIQKQTIGWINGGFKGKPLFLSNPVQFFNNIAVDQLALVKNKLIFDLNYMNREVAQRLLRDVAAQTKGLKIESTIVPDLCASLNDQLAAYYRLPPSTQRTQLIKSKQKQTNDICFGTPSQRYTNAKNCARDFACSGWSGILAVTSNIEQNTDAGRLAAAKNELDKKTQEESDRFKSELANGNGVLGQRECVKYERVEGREVCLQWNIKTPGSTLAASLNQTIMEPITSLQSSKNSQVILFLAPIVEAFSNKIIDLGVQKVNTVVTNAATDLQNEINRLSRSLDNNTNSLIDNLGGIENGINTTRTGNTELFPEIKDTTIYGLSDTDKTSTLSIIKVTFQGKLDSNSSARAFVENELNAYQRVFDSLEMISSCYKNKGGDYPNTIPAAIRERAATVRPILDSLLDVKLKSNQAQASMESLYSKMLEATDYRVFTGLTDSLNAAYGNILDKSFWAARNSHNQNDGVYANLSAEASNLISGPLSICQSVSTGGTGSGQ